MTNPHFHATEPIQPGSPAFPETLIQGSDPDREYGDGGVGYGVGDDELDDIPLRLTTRSLPDGGGFVMVVDGEIDLFTVPKLRDAIADTLATVARGGPEQANRRGLVVDLRAVTFVDSAGLDALIDLRRRANPTGVPAAVVTLPTGQVQRVFALSRLDAYLNLHRLEADADLVWSALAPPAAFTASTASTAPKKDPPQ